MRNSSRRLGSAVLTVATVVALGLGGCSSTPSTISPQPAIQQVPAQSVPAKQKKAGTPTEIINQFNSLPETGPQPTNFEVVLSGNMVAAICGPTNPPCLDQPLYGPYNPFCPPSQGPNNPCYPTVTYDPATNTTTVTYSGPTLYENIPGHTNYYHFGLFATPTSSASVKGLELDSYWSYPSSPNNPQPMVSINWKGFAKSAPKWTYAEVFVSVSLTPGGPVAYGTWNELGYVAKGSQQPHFTFTNYGTQTLYVVSSGIIPNQPVPSDPDCAKNPSCPENMNILNILNFAGSPPPGDPNSSFIPLTYPPAKVLKPTRPG